MPVYYDNTTKFTKCKAGIKKICIWGKNCKFTTLIINSHSKICARKGVYYAGFK
jgi:hypothetical protein